MVMVTFTQRNEEVLECLMRGMKNQEIAQELKMAPRTVKQHLIRIAMKLGIEGKRYVTRVRIVYLIAQQRGLI